MHPADGSNRLDPDARRALALVATRLLTDEVTACLELGPEEVRRHLLRAILALGAHSKLEAVVIALREGLIDLPPAP